jgi:hypothetical protein
MTIYKCHFDGPRALGHFDGPRALEQLAFVKGHRMGVEELDLEERICNGSSFFFGPFDSNFNEEQ